MSRKLKLGIAQKATLENLDLTLKALEATVQEAARAGIDLILLPEAYLGGYPRTCSFGSSVGACSVEGREQYLQYLRSAVDLGDTPSGAGDGWIERSLPVSENARYRGDGTRETLERIARETGVFLVTGVIERCDGTLYCAVVYVCPTDGVLGKRRMIMPVTRFYNHSI